MVSTLPTHIFESAFSSHPRRNLFEYRKLEKALDCGGIQADAFKVKPLETLETYYAIAGEEERRKTIFKEEVEWLLSRNIHFVCSDTVPVACRSAKLASIPSAVVSNLSWDHIYAHFLDDVSTDSEVKMYADMIGTITEDYKCAEFLLRLPGSHPMPAYDGGGGGGGGANCIQSSEVLDMPFVVRKARKTKEDVRRELGINEDTKLLLLMFGGLSGDVSWKLDNESLPDKWVCAVCSAIWPTCLDGDGDGGGGRRGDENFLRLDRDVYLPDIIEAADVVLGKIGYGSVSECICHRTPLIYVPRKNFAEEKYLKALLSKFNTCTEMSSEDFRSGKWKEAIEEADRLEPNFEGNANGGFECAKTILRLVRK